MNANTQEEFRTALVGVVGLVNNYKAVVPTIVVRGRRDKAEKDATAALFCAIARFGSTAKAADQYEWSDKAIRDRMEAVSFGVMLSNIRKIVAAKGDEAEAFIGEHSSIQNAYKAVCEAAKPVVATVEAVEAVSVTNDEVEGESVLQVAMRAAAALGAADLEVLADYVATLSMALTESARQLVAA